MNKYTNQRSRDQVGKAGCLQRPHVGGFSLISAIFLLVILAGLGVAMVKVFTTQQTGSSMDVMDERAYQAARAGMEWGLYERLQAPTSSSYCNTTIPTATTTSSFSLPTTSTLSAFTVTVQCTYVPGIQVSANFIGAGGTVTATTTTAHNFLPGTQISVRNAGATFNTVTGGVTVLTVPSTTQLTYASSATGSASGNITAANLDRWLIVATACNQPAATGACPNSAPTSPDYVQRSVQAQL